MVWLISHMIAKPRCSWQLTDWNCPQGGRFRTPRLVAFPHQEGWKTTVCYRLSLNEAAVPGTPNEATADVGWGPTIRGLSLAPPRTSRGIGTGEGSILQRARFESSGSGGCSEARRCQIQHRREDYEGCHHHRDCDRCSCSRRLPQGSPPRAHEARRTGCRARCSVTIAVHSTSVDRIDWRLRGFAVQPLSFYGLSNASDLRRALHAPRSPFAARFRLIVCRGGLPCERKLFTQCGTARSGKA